MGLNYRGAVGIEPPKGYNYVGLRKLNTGFGHRVDIHSHTLYYESGGKNGGNFFVLYLSLVGVSKEIGIANNLSPKGNMFSPS